MTPGWDAGKPPRRASPVKAATTMIPRASAMSISLPEQALGGPHRLMLMIGALGDRSVDGARQAQTIADRAGLFLPAGAQRDQPRVGGDAGYAHAIVARAAITPATAVPC